MTLSLLKKLPKITLGKIAGILALPAILAVSGIIVWSGSTEAFSATSTNAVESWNNGEITLSDNNGSALFSTDGIVPGYTETKCITVTSSTNFPVELKMYTSDVSSTGPEGSPKLSSHLNITVAGGSGGSNTDTGCVGFIPDADQTSSPAFTGTLESFSKNDSYANGIGDYILPSGESRQYQITIDFPFDSPNSLQGTSATGTFAWTAQQIISAN